MRARATREVLLGFPADVANGRGGRADGPMVLAALALLHLGNGAARRGGPYPLGRDRHRPHTGQCQTAQNRHDLETHDLIHLTPSGNSRVLAAGAPFVVHLRIRKNASLFDVVDQLIQGESPPRG